METANELLRNWRDINRAKGTKPSRQYPDQVPPSPPSIDASLGQLKLSGPEPAPPIDTYGRPASVPPPDRYPDPRYQPQPPPQQQFPSPQAGSTYGPPRPIQGPPPGARVPVAPGYPQEPIIPGRMPGPYDGAPTPGSYGPPSGYQHPPRLPMPATQQPRPMPPVPGGAGPQGRPVERPGSVPLPATQQSPRLGQVQPQLTKQGSRKRKVGLDDFNFLAVLGKGNFGKVMLAEEKKTNMLYAIKVLKKEFIIDNDEVESTRSEKRVFLAAAKERHPFLLGLHSCFQTETRVYFVMEYVSGGDLMLHIQRKQFSLRQAKFYASEVLLALEYFHANGIIYRDLKLDNILLTLDGHVKVADYGLCKEEMWYGQTTSTFCGTPEFMAPEILLEQRYGRAVDWWAFGVLTYEMLLGQSPFRGEDEDEIFDAILEDEPLYPITMPRDAVSILQKLLTRDPNRRLGSGKEDAEEIKRQPFFKDVSWDDVFHKRIPSPYFPTINGSADTSNFDEEFTREQPTLTPVHGQLSTRDQAEFNGFSWVAGWADM